MDSPYLWQIGYGALGGAGIYLVFHGILSIRLLRLQFEVATLRSQFLSVLNRQKVEKRWNARDQFEQEVLGAMTKQAKVIPRYDNDPLVYDPKER